MKLNFEQIKEILPHRYPMLMIESVEDYVAGQYLIATKSISGSDPVFQGHYPDFAIFPGVLLIETMAQTASLLGYFSMDELGLSSDSEGLPLLVSADRMRFRSPVKPGDFLTIEARFQRKKLRNIYYQASVKCGDRRVCDGLLSSTLISPAAFKL